MTHASASSAPPPHVDLIALFGFLSAVVTLGCLPHWRSSRKMKLVFAACLAANAAYAFLSGAWPLGLLAIVATGMALQSFWVDRFTARWWPMTVAQLRHKEGRDLVEYGSRGLRLFGSSAPENN
jgi:hypothetical protein